VLVLDEPTAGLDPQGRHQLLDHILGLHREQALTLVIISHNMEELAGICDRLYVIADGRTVMDGPPGQIFRQASALRRLGLDVPAVTTLMDRLIGEDLLAPGPTVYTVEQANAVLVERMKDEG
jgi:energy-coupling factor transport system ATP-binding protein